MSGCTVSFIYVFFSLFLRLCRIVDKNLLSIVFRVFLYFLVSSFFIFCFSDKKIFVSGAFFLCFFPIIWILVCFISPLSFCLLWSLFSLLLPGAVFCSLFFVRLLFLVQRKTNLQRQSGAVFSPSLCFLGSW